MVGGNSVGDMWVIEVGSVPHMMNSCHNLPYVGYSITGPDIFFPVHVGALSPGVHNHHTYWHMNRIHPFTKP